jgi:hypothetical protein
MKVGKLEGKKVGRGDQRPESGERKGGGGEKKCKMQNEE